MRSCTLRTVLSLVLPLIAACQGVPLNDHQVELLENHMVSFDMLGRPLSPKTDINGWEIGDQVMTPQHYQERVRLIRERARLYLTGEPNRRLLVFIHGGLNTYEDSRERVLQQAERMMEDGYYPIFVAWNSGLMTSYWDNLVYEDGSVSGFKVAMSPFVLLRDLVVGVLNIPPRLTRSVMGRLGFGAGAREQTAASVAQGLDAANKSVGDAEDAAGSRQLDRTRQGVDLDILPQFETGGFGDYYKYSSWSPSSLVMPIGITTSFLVDAVGNGAWAGMIRRTKRLFDDEDIANIGRQDAHVGLSLLMRELSELQESLACGPEDGEPSTLRKVDSQRGLSILLSGLRRLLEKIRDPRYGKEVETVLAFVRTNLDGNRIDIQSAIRQRSMRFEHSLQDAGQGDAAPRTKEVLEIVLRLMYPDTVHDVTDITDAVLAAFSDIWQGATSQQIDLLIRVMDEVLPANGSVDKQKLELLVRGVADFVDMRLADVRRKEAKVDIFAHSMGTIVVNEILRRSEWFPTPRFQDIVYMGAACSIRDYEDSVFPYLARHKAYLTQFHNLMLHPRAENEEIVAYECGPRGSLLVYVDNYFASPSTVRDRTLGRFENIMLSVGRTQPEVADRIHMKVFSVGRSEPETHGGFTPAHFWAPGFFRTARQVKWQEDEAMRLQESAATSPPDPSIRPIR